MWGSDEGLGKEGLWGVVEFLQALLMHTSEGMLTMDSASQIVFANPAIEDIIGYQPAELVGRSMTTIIPERLRSSHETGVNEYLETGERHIDWSGVELPALHKDGHEVEVSVSFREFEYDGKRLFTGVFTDISERKQREEQLREQKQELEDFAHLLSHDIRNPLSIAKGYLELIADERDTSDVQRVKTALTRIEEIIDDTQHSTFYGDADADLSVLSLQETARKAWQSVLTKEAELELPESEWKIRANEGRFCQLLENVIRNAVEHGGAAVKVKVGILDGAEGFYVEDSGVGIPSGLKLQLETPSGLQRQQDAGYGLEIIQNVAAEHDWGMEISDAESGGARFEFDRATVFQV